MDRSRILERLRRIETEVTGGYDKSKIFVAYTNKDGTYTHKDRSFTQEELDQHLKENDYEVVIIL
ncbi:hypothetical protein [Enterococcus sp. AZ196]|uniref:hypothetical protein n=1 Tax=Enterococcus sp. AZ196 TaxID=2774659 RepID=UPI003D28588E